jgi:hypothetical protein
MDLGCTNLETQAKKRITRFMFVFVEHVEDCFLDNERKY